jgi:anti-anti-sigma factor
MGATSVDDSGVEEPTRITIDGAPGLGEVRALRDAALAAAAAGTGVTVDCQRADHLHAAVIQVLLCLRRELEAAGRQLVLTNVSPAVKQFLDVAGVSELLRVEVAR